MRFKLLACALMLFTFSASAQLDIKYDESTKETEIKTKSQAATKTPQLQLLAIKEEVAADPSGNNIGLIFASKSDALQYEKCYKLVALADGQPVDVGESEQESEAGKGYVLEYVTASVNLKTLSTFAKAKEVKFKICNDFIVLTSAEVGQVREFYDAVAAAAVPATPPPAKAAPAAPATTAPSASPTAAPAPAAPSSAPAQSTPAPAAPPPASPPPAAKPATVG